MHTLVLCQRGTSLNQRFLNVIWGVKTQNEFLPPRCSRQNITEGLSFAEGTVPTPYGDLFIRWERRDGDFTLTVRKPEGAPLCVTAV